MHVQVVIKYEDDNKIVENNGIRRKIIDKLVHSELAGKYFAYDGEKSFFTVGPLPLPLPQDIFDFIVVLEEVSSRFILFLSFFLAILLLGSSVICSIAIMYHLLIVVLLNAYILVYCVISFFSFSFFPVAYLLM